MNQPRLIPPVPSTLRLACGAFVAFRLFGAGLAAAPIPPAEALQLPTRARIAGIHAAAHRDGWNPQVAGLRTAALQAYEQNKLAAAGAWLNLSRWAGLFGRQEGEFVEDWIQAVGAAKVGHANLPARYELRPQPLGAAAAPELQSWLLTNTAFTAEFFALRSPVDFLPRVLAILDELHRADPVRFRSHASLALALAVVYDLPPPPAWPHGQVPEAVLPRELPAVREAFAWWVRQDQLARTHHRLSRLSAGELKFLVDTPAPWSELEWVQRTVDLPLGELGRAYEMVRYRRERVAQQIAVWPGRTYRLADILAAGGICADQAYFASQAAKARGVPSLLFVGAGQDGWHAWFGFLGPGRKWQLDAGRYAEQRFVTGHAYDPQTWRRLSDHELRFLAEGFRRLPSYTQSAIHADFAAEYLAHGRPVEAGRAARQATRFERRNQAAWDTLLAAARREGRDARTVENLLREAAQAFQLYPDLEADYANQVAASLRLRGETSAAEAETRRVALRNRGERDDLSLRQARDSLRRALATEPLSGQVRVYQSALDTHGRGAGMAFFSEIVVPFAEHLVALDQRGEATRAVERARRTLRVEPGTQLALELEQLAQRVRPGR